jgi:hypothetical protein
MKITWKRILIDEGVTLSKVYLNGKYECFGLEDPVREAKIKSITAIPAGNYKVELRHSPRFTPRYGHEMLWLRNVSNFEFILIHPGNTVDDTDGCLLVGSRVGVLKNKIAILNSVATYNIFYRKVVEFARNKTLEIEIINIK